MTSDIDLVRGLLHFSFMWSHPFFVLFSRACFYKDFDAGRAKYCSPLVVNAHTSNRWDNHGKSLAYALLDQRGQVGQRPIVFAAHSLGGLVCEEALNLSSKRHDLASIWPNTLGIIFMGTPHGGSYLASWGSTVAKYVNIFHGVNREILGNLQPGSSDLQRTEEDFQHMLQ